MSTLENDYLTVTEAAALLRVAPSTVRRWIRQGDVPAYRLGRRRVAILRGDLVTLITPIQPGMSLISDERDIEALRTRKLTPEEKERALEAIERAQRDANELQARRGGKLFSPSWEIIAEMRDERTRELS